MGIDKLFVKFCIYLISTFDADYICIQFFIVLCIYFTCTAVDFDRFTYTVYLGRKFMYEFYFNPLTVTSSNNLVPCLFVDIGPGYVLLSNGTKS